jgi:hypothetical protein
MKMPGDPDPLYVAARAALLDTLDALREHHDALVLVGAQAVYVHTGATTLSVAEYTTDADFCIAPDLLADSPLLADRLLANGYEFGANPGSWISPRGITVDLMVPEALAGAGSRGARLGPHGNRAARRAKGLEASLLDRERTTITALEPSDERSVEIWVAGPSALLIAKIHKITERLDSPDRLSDKDALDVFRLLQSVSTNSLSNRLNELRSSDLAGDVTVQAIDILPALFGATDSPGTVMAVRAAGEQSLDAIIAASFVALAQDLVDELAI